MSRRHVPGSGRHALLHAVVGRMTAAFRLVYGRTISWAIAAPAFGGMTVLLLWSSQVLSVDGGAVRVLIEPEFMVAALAISVLFALLVPMQVYAARLAAVTARQTGGTVLGALAGTASMSCCAPVIFPSILSVLGFSGTTILSFNLTVARYWLPLATASIILLLFSLVSVARSLELECSLPDFEDRLR